MKKIFPVACISLSLFLLSCGGKTAAPDGKTGENKTAGATGPDAAAGSGYISCKLNGKDWTNNSASATQTGNSFLNIASDEDQKEAISIIENHPATGMFSFNKGISGSYTDPSGKSFGSKDGSGTVTITSYTAPADNKTDGHIEGSFSGTFSFDPATSVVITKGKFSMPVKKL